MSRSNEPLIFELSSPGRMGVDLPDCDVPSKDLRQLIPEHLIAQEGPDLPEVSEVDVIRHFTRLSRRNFGVDVGSYPLGSCTMKYNPKVNEDIARLSGFESLHPLQPVEDAQGLLALIRTRAVPMRDRWYGLRQPSACSRSPRRDDWVDAYQGFPQRKRRCKEAQGPRA